MPLKRLNWEPFNHRSLNQFLSGADRGLAVFDWDNTCIFGDIGEAFFRNQVFNLYFKMSPREFSDLIPEKVNGCDCIQIESHFLNLTELKGNLVKDYTFLAEQGLNPRKVSVCDQYRSFTTQLLALYQGFEQSSGIGPAFAYEWVIGLLTGFKPAEVGRFTWHTFKKQVRKKIGPQSVEDSNRSIALKWVEGLRPYPEMKNLMAALKKTGFTVAVLTATSHWIVRGLIVNLGWPVDHLIGMTSLLEGGVITSRPNPNLACNFGLGKVANLQKQLCQEPLLVAGDSDSDVPLMTYSAKTGMRLIIDRNLTGEIEALYKKARKKEPGYLLQPVDFSKGTFHNSSRVGAT